MRRFYRIIMMLVLLFTSQALNAQIVTCPAPTGVTVSDITTYNATISWTNGGTESLWELIIGDSTYYPTSNSYTTNTLHSNTQYIVSVRAICDSGDTSTAVLDSFSTACPSHITYRDLPLFEDFESYGYGLLRRCKSFTFIL